MERMVHGYTNITTTDRRTVTKHYVGPDADVRRVREVTVLRAVAGRLPVPAVLAQSADSMTTTFVAGVQGQELLASVGAGPVLRACGRVLREVHRIDVRTVFPDATAPGQVLVHGDFGPNNVLIEQRGIRVSAILDWEWASAGDFVDDLAWCEWIIRMHHAEHRDALGELFDAYGVYPSWTQRHSAMVRKMQSLLAFSERRDPDDLASRTNRARLAATEAFTE